MPHQVEVKGTDRDKIFLTQKELAKRWRMTEGTIIKMRDNGIVPFFRLPDSNRILYPVISVLAIEKKHTIPTQEAQKTRQIPSVSKRKKPVL